MPYTVNQCVFVCVHVCVCVCARACVRVCYFFLSFLFFCCTVIVKRFVRIIGKHVRIMEKNNNREWNNFEEKKEQGAGTP